MYSVPKKVEPVYVSKIWGGTRIAKDMNRVLPADDIGEAWDVSAIEGMQSGVRLGEQLMPLAEYANHPDFYGETVFESFPLLIKVLGATDILSVQVHPSDDNCLPGEAGKAEAWYILSAEPGAQLVFGLNCTKEEFARNVAEGKTEEGLNVVNVREGDVFNIRPGLVHAIGAGITLYEVQQTSDTTYRVFDFNRKDAKGNLRELHIERALAVCDDTLKSEKTIGYSFKEDDNTRTVYLNTEYFALERLSVSGILRDSWFNSFGLYTVTKGEGIACCAGGSIEIKKGDVFILPAAAGEIRFEGELEILKSHRPKKERYQKWLAAIGASTGEDGSVCAR